MCKLPVLMYHNITNDPRKIGRLTVDMNDLEKQFSLICQKRYKTYHFKDLEHKAKLPGKSIIITFDDVTKNQLLYALPLLKKYNLKATFFIPFAYIGGHDVWNNGEEAIMDLIELKEMDDLVELGFHSYLHRPFSELSKEEIEEDFNACFKVCQDHNLNVYPVIAYPYGNYPKMADEKKLFFEYLNKHKMKYGVRIGNKINNYPFRNPYEIKRIDVRGTESFFMFKLKLKYGKIF